ncbi:MAG: D-aminoacylase [Desulfobacteraceae bacterium]|jgi:N-acyl-D-amino-acid deacylase
MSSVKTVIRGGRIVDGTGSDGYVADVAIAEGKIVRIGPNLPPETEEETIPAEGLVVSPGFVDAHSHDDLYLLIDPACSVKVAQGVTTTVIGNCGVSAAPLVEEAFEDVLDILRLFGGEEAAREHFSVQTFEGFNKKLRGAGLGIHVVPLVGHTTVRMAVMGSEHRAPDRRELSVMCDHVEQAMEAGAFGLSSGLIYAPGSYAAPEEIAALCQVVEGRGGVYTTHIRNEGDLLIHAVEEAIQVGRETGVPVHISHHKAMGRNNRGRSADSLRIMAEARTEGIRTTCDQYPYNAASTTLSAALPHDALNEGVEQLREKLQDPAVREAYRFEMEKGGGTGGENLVQLAGFEGIVVSASQARPDCIGASIAQAAERAGVDPFDLVFDLVSEEARGTFVVVFAMSDEDIEWIMQDPFTMVGTDGIPAFGESKTHPRMTGTFPRVLGTYVRERGVLSLEEAVRKMTSLPCRTFGLHGKGVIEEGYDADLVIFDPERIRDGSTYDQPYLKPEGIHTVFVAGEAAVKDGDVQGVRSGKVLKPHSA